ERLVAEVERPQGGRGRRGAHQELASGHAQGDGGVLAAQGSLLGGHVGHRGSLLRRGNSDQRVLILTTGCRGPAPARGRSPFGPTASGGPSPPSASVARLRNRPRNPERTASRPNQRPVGVVASTRQASSSIRFLLTKR